MAKSKVYFSRKISPANVIKMYEALGVELPGKVACKVHSGEGGNQNFIRPNFWKPMVDKVNGTIIECCTAYPGPRLKGDTHQQLMKDHGWVTAFGEDRVDVMDAEGPDFVIDYPEGKILKKDVVGKTITNYDSCLVLSHFKGHGMGGFGGALKQLSIGFGSSAGKSLIHSAGQCDDPGTRRAFAAQQDDFITCMADAAGAVVKHFDGKMAFISVARDLSVDCDCMPTAVPPCMADIGMFASLDPVAIDKACLDMVYNSDDPGKAEMIERIESRHGQFIIPDAVALGYGSDEYELIDLDK